jgi:hypothetical protein
MLTGNSCLDAGPVDKCSSGEKSDITSEVIDFKQSIRLQELNTVTGFIALCMKWFMCCSYGCVLNEHLYNVVFHSHGILRSVILNFWIDKEPFFFSFLGFPQWKNQSKTVLVVCAWNRCPIMRRFKSRHKETTNKVARTANRKNGVWKFGFPLHRFSQLISMRLSCRLA